jgi:hypothetical protein
MPQPLLYLLNQSATDTMSAATLTEALATLRLERAGARMAACSVLFAAGEKTGGLPDIVAAARQRHPQLAALNIASHPARPPEADLGKVDLLVFTADAPADRRLLFEAIHRRVPVLAPDNWQDAWVRDGVTGFLYRAGNPDSLALSLLAFAIVAPETMYAILDRAERRCLAVSARLEAGLPRHATGESR